MARSPADGPAGRPADVPAGESLGGALGAEPNTNGVVFWPVVAAAVLVDLATKAYAQATLGAPGFPHRVLGDAVRFTLVYNPGAAFSLHLGPYSRAIFLALTAVVLRVLWTLYRRTRDRDNARVLALALLVGGAVGNAIDRLRSPLGVVDWLDVGVGPHRWPTFNVADVAVTAGAVLLAAVLWREERDGAASPNASGPPASGPPAPTPAEGMPNGAAPAVLRAEAA